jgi:transcriptional regulator with XRE-family HTH domain
MNFNKIKNICEQKGLTIPQLAEKIDLSEAGLYQSFRNMGLF